MGPLRWEKGLKKGVDDYNQSNLWVQISQKWWTKAVKITSIWAPHLTPTPCRSHIQGLSKSYSSSAEKLSCYRDFSRKKGSKTKRGMLILQSRLKKKLNNLHGPPF